MRDNDKVAKEWKRLQDEGWTVRDGAFYPPLPPGMPGDPPGTSLEPAPLPAPEIVDYSACKLRKKRNASFAQLDGAAEENDKNTGYKDPDKAPEKGAEDKIGELY